MVDAVFELIPDIINNLDPDPFFSFYGNLSTKSYRKNSNSDPDLHYGRSPRSKTARRMRNCGFVGRKSKIYQKIVKTSIKQFSFQFKIYFLKA